MIVERLGYYNLSKVQKMYEDGELFSIYETKKNTHILIKNCQLKEVQLYYVDKSRLPYKIVEGKKITSGKQVFCSKESVLAESKWNQIMAYESYHTL